MNPIVLAAQIEDLNEALVAQLLTREPTWNQNDRKSFIIGKAILGKCLFGRHICAFFASFRLIKEHERAKVCIMQSYISRRLELCKKLKSNDKLTIFLLFHFSIRTQAVDKKRSKLVSYQGRTGDGARRHANRHPGPCSIHPSQTLDFTLKSLRIFISA